MCWRDVDRAEVLAVATNLWKNAGRFTALRIHLAYALLAFLGAGSIAWPSAAWEKTHAGRLVIEFEGGVISSEIADALNKFAAVPGIIPWRSHTFRTEDKDGCSLLAKALNVPAYYCSEAVLAALMAFSAAQGKGKAATPRPRSGAELAVPDVEAENYVFHRTFDLSREKQRLEYFNLIKNPEWQKLLRSSPTDKAPSQSQVRKLDFNGLRWYVLLKEPGALARAEVLALDISKPNVSVYLERASQLRSVAPRKFAEILPSRFFELCRNEKTGHRGSYLKYFTSDYDASRAYQCESSSKVPEVFVIDSKVAPHPDIPLANTPPSADAAADVSCPTGPSWNRDLHHGTYLAGIIASRGHSMGFVGVNPKSVIQNIPWVRGAQDHDLVERIRQSHKQHEPMIYVFASNFNGLEETKKNDDLRERIWHKSGDNYSDTDFKHKDIRTLQVRGNRAIAQNIWPIFVVAAGQNQSEGNDHVGDELRLTSALSPQNIGDYSNVIVVTACTDCQSSNAALWSKANYGARGAHLVHLAAPGGEPIPGILDDRAAGAPQFGGTSASAAFTAGVAARMLACHPDYYQSSLGRLKAQLLVTARANIREADRDKVPGGTVDPSLALINPKKTWLKLAGVDGITEVKSFRHWCMTSLTLLAEDGNEQAVALRKVRRITAGSATSSYVMRELTEDDALGSTTLALDVKGPGEGDRQEYVVAVEIEAKGVCKLRLGDIQDLILRSELPEQKKVQTCAQLRPCFQ